MKDWNGNSKAVYVTNGDSSHSTRDRETRDYYATDPRARIYVFTKRINCALNGEEKFFNASSAVCYAWFVWEKGSTAKPVIDWL